MKYKLTVILHFDEKDADYLNVARDALLPLYQNAIVTNEGTKNEGRGFIDLEKCYHDQVPMLPCEIIARWEVGRGKVYPEE